MLDYSDDVRAQEATVIAAYNTLLASNLATFTASNAGVTAGIVNTTTAFQAAIDDPQAYGAANATCYDDDGTTCLWWNNYHPGIASTWPSFLYFGTWERSVQKEVMVLTWWVLQFMNSSHRRSPLRGPNSSLELDKLREVARDAGHLPLMLWEPSVGVHRIIHM